MHKYFSTNKNKLEAALTVLGHCSEHSLENVVVNNDVQKAEGIEVAIKGKGQDGRQQEQHHIQSP